MLKKIKKLLRKVVNELTKDTTLQISAPQEKLQQFLHRFVADEYGHRAIYESGDLGYGWIHYSFIRTHKPKKVLCVGSRFGYIPAVLAQACKDNGFGDVSFVDAGFGPDDEQNWTGEAFWRAKEGQQLFKKTHLDNFITLFVMTTQEFAQKYDSLRFDYIYIDGDHSFKGALRDYKLFWPLLSEDGFMSFHDISVKETLTEGEYGVHKVWDMIRKKHQSAIEFSFIGSGLGIVQKKVSPPPGRVSKK